MFNFYIFFKATTEEAMLEKALAVSTVGDVSMTPASMDFTAMTEDEQIAYALRLSMENAGIGMS